jgi:hypothetical protein
MSDFDEEVPDEAEQLDQLQPEETLLDRGVADVLDEGYVSAENWSAAQGFGNTAAEMRQGETLEVRVTQELPESEEPGEPWRPEPGQRGQVGDKRAGRLVDANGGLVGEDSEAQSIARDVGIDGGAATAEEAAMHVIDDLDDDEA